VNAVRITADVGKTYHGAPLALPTGRRKGEVSAEGYRSGSIPKANFNPNPADSLRAIVLSDGKFTGLASRPGTLLTFVISGDLALSLFRRSFSISGLVTSCSRTDRAHLSR